MTFAHMARRAAKLAVDNSPTILTSIGVVGTMTTAYLAGKASFQAADIIRLKEAIDSEVSEPERGELIRDPREIMKDRVQLVWRLYIPAATMGAATMACIIGANKVGARRAAGLAAAYSILEKTGEEYKQKVIEKLGEKKEEAIRDEIMKDRITDSYDEGLEIYGLDTGQLCYDKFTTLYFRSDVETIRSRVNDFNEMLLHDGYGSAAEFYRILEIPAPAYTEGIGWNTDKKLELKIGAHMTVTNKPCIAIEFRQEPSPDYGRFR